MNLQQDASLDEDAIDTTPSPVNLKYCSLNLNIKIGGQMATLKMVL